MGQETIFAVKFGELESQYERTVSRLRRCQTENRKQIRQELGTVLDEYCDAERRLQKSVNSSRSPAVSALSEAQLNYHRSVRRILHDELPCHLHGEDGDFSADQVEAVSLYGEFAIDFATQAMRYAQMVMLSALDAQAGLNEQEGGTT